jgi:membrane-associated phospholipid phosphatase
VKFQHYLIVTHNEALSSLGTGISAFPSIHVAIATLYALVGWRISRFARVVSLAFLATILVGSIHLGWHYSLDGYASIIGTCAIYRAVGWALRRGAPLLRDRRPTGNPAAVG